MSTASIILPSTLRRVTATLFVAQSLALAALNAATTISGIAGAELGGEWAAGLPTTFALIGGALAAYPAGHLMGRGGRRLGLSAGYAAGIVGGLITGFSMAAHSLPVFVFGMVFLGAARAVSDQARYATADVYPPHLRGRAVSAIVFAGTIGAVLGPALSPVAGRVATDLGYSELVGPWFVPPLLLIATLIFINLLLHPDPRDIARRLQTPDAPQLSYPAADPGRSFWQVMSSPQARLALLSMGLAQTVMVMVMTITPVYMRHHTHGLDEISFVTAAHILGMYGLSMAAGWMADRWSRRATIGLGSVLLIAACLAAPQNPDTWPLAVSLFLLGLGWNLCFVAGSSLLTDALDVAETARFQGAADLLVNLASAVGSLGSGLLIASLGFGTLAAIGAGLALLIGASSLKRHRSLPLNPPRQATSQNA